jgi:RND superfamily putative drug exporter
MPTFASELALLIGLGVGVDYALFILTRYRQAVLRGLDGNMAVLEAVDTAGRAVLFAGLTVCVALLGMFALGVSALSGAAVAAAIGVASTVIAALTLLPALLAAFGTRVLRRRERRSLKAGAAQAVDESPAWLRWANRLQRRPVIVAALAATLLAVTAIPAFSIRLGSADAGLDPTGWTTHKAYQLLATGFGAGHNGPLQLVAQVSGPTQQTSFVDVEQAVARTPGVAGATQPRFLPDRLPGLPGVALADVYPRGSPQAAATSDLLHAVRTHVIPAAERGSGLDVLVGGQTASADDFGTVISRKLPLLVGGIVVLSFLILMAVFRSLLIPTIAAIMNLLSAAAAFGIVTAVFQDGVGLSLLGINQTGPIESFAPVVMFAILFGLAMDYEVFLVTRIHEEWHRRADNREAVSHGLAATGPTITARRDHDPRLRRVHPRRPADHRTGRSGARQRRPARRRGHPLDPRPRRHVQARRRQLEAAGAPRQSHAPPSSRGSGRPRPGAPPSRNSVN